MGGIVSPSGPELAAAVSEAGGLGMIGGAFVEPDELRKQIRQIREETDKPFGVDMKIGVVVGAVRHTQKSLASGVDFVVAQGNDGGGHNSTVGTMALIPQVVDEVAGRIPVLGAGSIMGGRQMVAAMALGAQGVWCGSAFLPTPEARLTDLQRQSLVDASTTYRW
jgi:NAD(P)H-dependent flavin oxidoreductase YrpB (nitropropane dioxygenase family)